MKKYEPRCMLVTGGCGFIGANFIRYVLANDPGIKIINLDKLTYAAKKTNLLDLPLHRYRFFRGDITDATLVQKILEENHVDTIVHFAAESHVDRSIAAPVVFVKTNVVGTLVLLECARQYWQDTQNWSPDLCRFHHISTDEVYGSLNVDDSSFCESTAYDPRSPYSASKAASDHLVKSYYHTYGLPITLSNCSNNYGPRQHEEKFIPTIINACLRQQLIPIYGSGKNIRDWLYVEDHCRGIMDVIKGGRLGESYNMGGNHECENITIAEMICAKIDALKIHSASTKKLISFVKDRPGHDFRYAINSSKIKDELGWQPHESFDSGLDKTIEYYLRQQDFSLKNNHVFDNV